MIRQIATVSTGTLLSRLLGFIRDALIASLLGAGAAADAFLLAFQLVNVARRLLSEGAFNAVLVPAYLRLRQQRGLVAATAFAGRVLGTVTIALIGATALFALVLPAVIGLLAPGFVETESYRIAVDTGRLMLPYLAFVGPVAVIMALLNANDRVAWSAFSPLLFNIALIAVTLTLLIGGFSDPRRVAMVLAVTVGIAGLLQASVLMFPGAQTARPIGVALDRDVLDLLWRAVPTTLAQSGPQLVVLVSAIAASLSPGGIAAIYFANRLIELPLGIVGVGAGAVYVTRLSASLHDGGHETRAVQSRAIELSMGLSLPAAVGLAVLARPIVDLLFQHGAFTADDALRTASVLTVLAAALPAHVLVKLFAPVFFAREQARWPLFAMVAGLVVAAVAALVLQARHAETGVAAAIVAGAWVAALTLGLRLGMTHGFSLDPEARWRLPRILLASIAMAIFLFGAAALFGGVGHANSSLALRVARLALLIGGGMSVYAALLRLLGVLDLAVMKRAFRPAR